MILNKKMKIFLFLILFFIQVVFSNEQYMTQKNEHNFIKSRISEINKKLYVAEHFDSIISSHWIVVTSISPPTPSVILLSRLPHWSLVVVGDSLSPPSYHIPGSIFLSLSFQRSLGYSIEPLLPINSYSRKLIGYLYAIQHGATVIYETDDDNLLINDLNGFLSSNQTQILHYYPNTNKILPVVNPYAYFGHPSVWPRGYPLESINDDISNEFYYDSANTLIQQSLANGDPDVDAIFRLTRKLKNSKIDIQFNSSQEPVSLPQGIFCPYNSQNTLHHYSAFWGLFIPTTVTFRVSDIWRSYWAQRLLWEIGGVLTFLPPMVYQERNVHNYLKDFEDEIMLYEQTGRLIKFLLKWKPKSEKIEEMMKELTKEMGKEGFWKEEEEKIMEAWIEDLKKIGYEYPKKKKIKKGKKETIKRKEKEETDKGMKGVKIATSNIETKEEKKCPEMKKEFPDIIKSTVKIEKEIKEKYFWDIILIIHFSWPYFDNIEYLKEIYSKEFPNIVFYADIEKEKCPKEIVPIDTFHGSYQYHALSDAIIRYPGYKGYLFINDDVFVKYWKLKRLNKDKFWEAWNVKDPERAKKENYKSTGYKTNLFEEDPKDRKWAFKNRKEELKLAYNCIDKKYLDMLEQSTGNRKIWVGQTADFIYVPGKFAKEFTILASWFYDIKVWFAIAIPNIIRMIDKEENFEKVYAVYLWREQRINWKNYVYKEEVEFIHPIKFSKEDTRKYIKQLIKNLTL